MASRWTLRLYLVLSLALGAACRTTPSNGAKSSQSWGGLEVQVMGGPASGPTPRVVVLLHGWGAPGDDLVPLAQDRWPGPTRSSWCRRRRCPIPAAVAPGGTSTSSAGSGPSPRARARSPTTFPKGSPPPAARVQGLLRDVRTRYQPEVLILAGFSQGGMLAMDVALAADPPVDRVAVLSGTLLAESLWRERMARPTKPAVFLSHGRQDGVLPFASSERLKALLAGERLSP